MEQFLLDYQLDRPTWFYLSFLLIVAIYFRFTRVWSLRNLDLLLLLSLSPGLLWVEAGSRLGYVWLYCSTAAILVRVLIDRRFSRRPRLPQNLNTAGLTFLLIACCLFHIAEILTTPRLPASAVHTARRAARLVQRQDATALATMPRRDREPHAGPAAAVLTAPALGLSHAVTANDSPKERDTLIDLSVRLTALAAHAAVVAALVILGAKLFGDIALGVGMATLYLVLPCTAYNVAHVNHVLPAALLLWAAILHRNPYASGGLMGLACGTLFFPLFLLPIWTTFYGRRNGVRFLAALVPVAALLLLSVAMTAVDRDSFVRQVFVLSDWSLLRFEGTDATGVWAGIDSLYRIPVFFLFLLLVGGLAFWPRDRTLDRLLARSTATVAAIQFWYPHQGGVYLLWFLPLLLAVMFRPALTAHAPTATVPWPWERWRVRPQPERPLAPTGVGPV